MTEIPDDAIACWNFDCKILKDWSPLPAIGEITQAHMAPARIDGNADLSGGLSWLAGLPALPPRPIRMRGYVRLMDALSDALGDNISRCRVWGDVERDQYGVLLGTYRVMDQRIDAGPLLKDFARRQALSVAHMWDMPQIMREHLETGDDQTRDEARRQTWSGASTRALLREPWGGIAVGAPTRAAMAAWLGTARHQGHSVAWDAAEAASLAQWLALGGTCAGDAAMAAAKESANTMLEGMVMAAMGINPEAAA